MKFIRILLTLLALAAALAAVLVLLAIAPAVQTRVARMEINRHTGLQGTLGNVTAGFGEVEIEDLHLEANGAVLNLPTLRAKLPLTTAALHRRALVRVLVAKGWTLDLSRAGGKAESLESILGTLLIGRELPFELSLDGVDLEGDVLLPAPPGGARRRCM